jgi:hypothetical protein
MVEEHLRKVVSAQQRHEEQSIPIFLLAYKASTHETTGATPASIVFGRELRPLRDIMFGVSPHKDQSTTDNVVDVVDRPHRIYHYACQHFKVASDRMKARYNRRIPLRGESLAVPSYPDQRKVT